MLKSQSVCKKLKKKKEDIQNKIKILKCKEKKFQGKRKFNNLKKFRYQAKETLRPNLFNQFLSNQKINKFRFIYKKLMIKNA